MKTLIVGETTVIDTIVLGADGKKAYGLSVLYEIRKVDGNVLVEAGTCGEVMGVYYVNVLIATEGQYRIQFSTPIGYEDGEELFMVAAEPAKEASVQALDAKLDVISSTLETILTAIGAISPIDETKLDRILGMVQENYRIVSPVYNSNGMLTSSTIKLFHSADDCNNNVNAFATYSVTATYNTLNHLTSYKVTKN